jgi:oxygen-independent coproporphyrinogen-3 oxidase
MRSFRAPPGLYIHVPFCSQICPFCPYNKILFETGVAGRFFAALSGETDAYGQLAKEPFRSLYIGGGTPTLCISELSKLLPRIAVSGEIAIEVLPNHASRDRLSEMRDIGINYVSLGIQSFDQRMLEYLRRPNSASENSAALENAVGMFDCVDIDLIFDVSFNDQNVFLADLGRCFETGVEQVSTYPLMRFGYTPFGKTRHDPKTEHAHLARAAELAESYGYERRSVWTFNKRSAPSYTSITRESCLGLGAGAASFTGSLFTVNHFSVSEYCRDVEEGRLPIARYNRLGELRAAAYYLFWQAYTGRVDLARFKTLYPRAAVLEWVVSALKRGGFLVAENDILRLSQRGYDGYHDLERWVTYQFIEPLWGDLMREHKNWKPPPNENRSRLKAFGLSISGIRHAGPIALTS